MPAQLKPALDRILTAVKQFTLAQRVFAVLAAAGIVVAAVAVFGWMSKPTMTPLFSGLSGADASAVVDQLQADGVSYELADGGSTVLVPTDKVYSERIALAAKGLPKDADGAGYSLLDGLSATSTQFQEQTTYQRAMEGELAKTITAMDGVASASVKLAIPEETVFSSHKQNPTASVFVRQVGTKPLAASQVQAIIHLVSAAVPGMEPGHVAVIDADGQVLSTVGGSGVGGAMADQQTNDYEAKVSASVHSLLDPLVGAQNVTVTTSAKLNYDATKRTVESYQAQEGVPPLASSTRTEEYGQGGDGATGVLGPDNIAVPGGAGNGDGNYRSTSEDVTNAVGKTTEVTQAAPGGVERQSVSVVLDSATAGKLDLVALESAIAAAAGIDVDRGDTLSVQRLPFDTTTAEAAEAALAKAEAEAKAEATRNLVKQIIITALVLLAVVIMLVLMGRRSRKSRREALDLGNLEAAEPEVALLEAAPLLPELEPASEPDPIVNKREQIAALADDQPEEVADLLRGWMAESGRR
ncbi:MAG: flagellar M-ring protein FliF [Micrococcales bacterium]|nr:flagellar M-ring protein FliF [Micrococcales bacterium]MCL2667252.1 flagellar M-ring protein FliF [Micrococcales bacterium]